MMHVKNSKTFGAILFGDIDFEVGKYPFFVCPSIFKVLNVGGGHHVDIKEANHMFLVELEACAVAVGARRGREGNFVLTLIRPNGWCKVARSSAAR